MKHFHPWLRFLVWKDSLAIRNAAFLMRRPHRSFRRTRRRDYVRSLKLPGYWSFTAKVWLMLWRHRRLFSLLVLLYVLFIFLIGGVTNQATYQEISDLVNQSTGEVSRGVWGSVGQAGLLLVSAFVSPGDISAEQQIYMSLIATMLWLTVVWLLRDIMAGHKPRLRDGIYSAGAPIAASIVVAVVGVIQLVPVGIVALVYSGLTSVGLLSEGVGLMIFWTFAVLVATLVLYWMTPTFLALVIVTLPGMYPMRALKVASDVVVGRRLRILYRILWMLLMVVLAWAAVMIPITLLDVALKNALSAIKSVPIVPVVAVIMSSVTAMWAATYIYLLYRRIIDDDASPA